MRSRLRVGIAPERPATEGVEAGRRVAVYMLDPDGGERLGLLAAAVGEGGWVDLPEPITVRAGDTFVAVPGPAAGGET